MSILAKQPDLEKIISKAVKRIGENHALARDNKGVGYKASQIEEDRKEFRKGIKRCCIFWKTRAAETSLIIEPRYCSV